MKFKKILVIAIIAIGSISHSKDWEFTKLKEKGIDNSFLCYEDAKFITDTSSRQYDFLKGASPKNYGIYNKNNTYLVAVNERYGSIGDRIEITFNNGVKINALIADFKKTRETIGWGIHPIGKNRGCMVEFLVDQTKIPDIVKKSGDFSTHIKRYAGGIKTLSNKNIK